MNELHIGKKLVNKIPVEGTQEYVVSGFIGPVTFVN